MLIEVIDAADVKLPLITIVFAAEAALTVLASALSPLGLGAPADEFLAGALLAKNR